MRRIAFSSNCGKRLRRWTGSSGCRKRTIGAREDALLKELNRVAPPGKKAPASFPSLGQAESGRYIRNRV